MAEPGSLGEVYARNRAGDLDYVPVEQPDTSTWLERVYGMIRQGITGDAQPGQRGTWVPSRINEQGQPELAVPGIIQQPAESLQSLMTAPLGDIVRSGDRDAMRAASEASFDVASMLPAAGVAAGRTMPTNAAGMGGGKLDPPLPMDKASRMARAKEMGFDTGTTYYHGSPDFRGVKNAGEFENRTTSRYNAETGQHEKAPQATYFTPDRRVAATYADDRRAWDYQNAEPEIFQAMLRPGNVLEIDAGGQKFSNLDRTLVKMQLPKEQQAEFDRLIKTYGNSPEGRSIKTGDLELIANMLGYDGFRLRGVKDAYDGGGKPTDVMALYDPSRIRSVNAAFDPAKKNSANLLASNADDPNTAAILAVLSGRGEKPRALPQVEQTWGPKWDILMGQQYRMAEAGGDLSTQYDILKAKLSKASGIDPEMRAAMEAKAQELAAEMGVEGRKAAGISANPDDPNTAAILAAMTGQDGSLPMDKASRMARAKEMGFDTDRVLYHGTGRNFEAFDIGADKVTGGGLNDQGVFLTPDTKAASRYATDFGGDAPQVLPLMTRSENPLSMSPAEFERLQGIAGSLRRGEPIDEVKGIFLEDTLSSLGIPWDATKGVHPLDAIKAAGFDAIEKRAGRGGSEPELMIFDPSRIRSVNAAFDPAKKNSANLLASNADDPTTAAILALLTAQQGGQPQQ